MDFTYTKFKWNGDPAADREHFIGGSDIGAILGLNPWKSAYTLWAEKTGLIKSPNISDKLQVWLGHKLEQVVADRYEMETGRKVRQSLMSYGIEEYPYLRGHVDRLVVGEHRGLECKTTSSYNRTDYDSGDVPPAYYAQCQFYMLVTGYQVWDIATLRDNREFFIQEIKRDDEYIAQMLAAAAAFWQCVTSVTPPAVDGTESTSDSLGYIYPGDSHADQLEGDERISAKVADIIAIDKSIRSLTEAKNCEINDIKEWMGNHTSAVTNSARISYRAATTRVVIDGKRLKAEHPEIYQQYTRPGTSYRTFSIREIKPQKEEDK